MAVQAITLLLLLPIASCHTELSAPRWRDDKRCGPDFRLLNGEPTECDPTGENPCCSRYGFCGNTTRHCDCDGCIRYEQRWRDDRRCGPNFSLLNGEQTECNPNGEFPCCSPYGFCGNTDRHCDCNTCINYNVRTAIPEPTRATTTVHEINVVPVIDGTAQTTPSETTTTTTTPNVTSVSTESSEPQWREDRRCGPNFLRLNGEQTECNPNSESPCCSKFGYCGNTSRHCDCDGCIRYESSAPRWRDDRRCGPNFHLLNGEQTECDPTGENPCCGKYGFCGNTTRHCDCDTCINYNVTTVAVRTPLTPITTSTPPVGVTCDPPEHCPDYYLCWGWDGPNKWSSHYKCPAAKERNTNNTCQLIHHIDNYVEVVRSMLPVAVPDYVSESYYTNVINDYNTALENALNHTYIWRNEKRDEDDILGGIRRTYQLANLFAPGIEKHYNAVQDKLENSNAGSLNVREFDLPKFITEISQIKEKGAELKSLNSSVFNDPESIISLMELVKTEADFIRDNATATLAKVREFKDHIASDVAAFNTSLKSVKQGLTHLEGLKKHTKSRIDQFKTRLNELKLERMEEKVIYEEIESEILADFEKLETVQIETLSPALAPSWLGFTMKVLTKISVVADLVLASKTNGGALELLNGQLSIFHKDDQSESDSTVGGREDISGMNFVNDSLDSVMEKGEMALPYIIEAEKNLLKLAELFDGIDAILNQLISEAKRVRGPVVILEFVSNTLTYLHHMQSNWNESYTDTIDLGDCVGLEPYQVPPPVLTLNIYHYFWVYSPYHAFGKPLVRSRIITSVIELPINKAGFIDDASQH